MAEWKATPEQQAAAQDRGGALLVAAAAGSGKTKVLVDRLMGYLTDPDDPADLDEFLIITYTRAAAAELRGKIAARLGEMLAEDPDNKHLQRQLTRVYLAQISTVHAFCQTVLRQYAAEADLPADFRVADEQQAAALRAEALQDTLAELYAGLNANPDFAAMIDTLGYGRDDRRLLALAEESYGVMRCQVDPAAWTRRCLQAYDLPEDAEAEQTLWGAWFLQERTRVLENADALLRQAEDLCRREPKLEEKCTPVLEKNRAAIRNLLAETTWDGCMEKKIASFGAMRPPKDAEAVEQVKALRKEAWEMVKDIQRCFYAPSRQVTDDLRRTVPALRGLLALLKAFDERFTQEKRRRHLLDFSDLEHCMIRLLTKKDTGAPTAAARSLAQTYREILIDEYQDSNAVQECIFQAVSREGKNLFLVGDVKQSIYRFRLADPTIFLEKYARFADFRTAAPGAPRRILLRENFRSRRAVLEGANHVFSNIMSRALGELDYDDAARLRAGASYPDDGEKPELAVLELPDADDDAPTPEKAALEADYVARRIRALIDGGTPVWENGAKRPAHYGDAVILLRNANSIGPVYRAALETHGIPVSAETSGGFYTSEEVSVLRSLLAVVDNPHQDVPLIAALRSPLFGLTADDLAAVRTCDREHDFYTAVTLAAETRDDCRDFLDVLARYRALSIELPLSEFLWHIVDDRAVMALTSAMPDGELRRRNVLLLLDLAQQFEQTGARGLHRFLLWMQRQETEGVEPAAPGGESRSVRILSIHKSKGLEFPFVFLCDTARLFNKSDARTSVLVHPALGLGPKCTDLEHGVEYPTIARQAIAAQLLTETLSEEMRLLYVAMTRAKERLVITGTVRDIGKTVSTLTATATVPLAPELLRAAQSPLHWLLQSALLDRDERFLRRNYVYLKADAAAERTEAEAEPTLPEPDPALLAQLGRALTFRYGHAQAIDLPSKVTATELKRLEAEDTPPEDTGAPLLAGAPRTQTFRRPDFSARARKLTAAERGTATHRILQYLHFADARTPEGIRAQVETLTARGQLTAREAQAVDTAALLRLGQTPLGAQLAAAEAAGTLRREFRFSLLCPAETFFPGAGDEQVLLQGVVDAWFETKDGLVIVDYKTDRIRPEGVPARTAYYAAQLHAYAGAMARITGRPVCRRVLYFLHCGRISDVPGPDA